MVVYKNIQSLDEKLRIIADFCCKKTRDDFWYLEIVTIQMDLGHIRFLHPKSVGRSLGLYKDNINDDFMLGLSNIQNVVGYLRGYDKKDNTVLIEPFKKIDKPDPEVFYPISTFAMKVDASAISYMEKLSKVEKQLLDSKAPSLVYEIKFRERQKIYLRDIYNNEIIETEPVKSIVGYFIKNDFIEKNGKNESVLLLNIIENSDKLGMVTCIPRDSNIIGTYQLNSIKDSIDTVIFN